LAGRQIPSPCAEAAGIERRTKVLADVAGVLLSRSCGLDVVGGAHDRDHVSGGIEDRLCFGEDAQDRTVAAHDEPISTDRGARPDLGEVGFRLMSEHQVERGFR
jgi:hypothetical protein